MSPRYVPHTWHDLPTTDTPIDKARLDELEAGVAAALVDDDAATLLDSAAAYSDTQDDVVRSDLTDVIANQAGAARDQAVSTAEQYALAQVDSLRAQLGGTAPYDPTLTYTVGQLAALGADVYAAVVPSGFSAVLTNLPPFGKGDGTEADHDLLLQRRVGFANGVTGGRGKPAFVINSNADTAGSAGAGTQTARWALAQVAANGGGKIIFDKTVNLVGGVATYKIGLLSDLLLRGNLHSNLTIDGRGCDVTITGGDGTYAGGGQPGKQTGPGTIPTFNTTTVYSGNQPDSGAGSQVKDPGDSNNVYICVSSVVQTDSVQPHLNSRWSKVSATWVSGTTYPRACRKVSPADSKTYVLTVPIGGGTTTAGVTMSNSASTVDPSTDRFDLNPTSGHWEPVGTLGFAVQLGATSYADFLDPAGSNGVPLTNVIFEKIAIVNKWGGENGDTGTHRDLEISWWCDNIWFDRCTLTNPDNNHDVLIACNGNGNITFSWCRFFQHFKAVHCGGTGGLVTPKIKLTSQVNPALQTSYGSTAAGFALWNDAANTQLLVSKISSTNLASLQAVIASSGGFFGEIEHGQSNPEQFTCTNINTSAANHDTLTIIRATLPKKHQAAIGYDGASDPLTNAAKTTSGYTIPHFPPGYETAYASITDSSGNTWVDQRVTFAHCMFEQLGFRGPEADDVNSKVHVFNCYTKDWGRASDVYGTIVFPCVPFGIAPTGSGGSANAQKNSQLYIENSSYQPSVLSGATATHAVANTSANPAFVKTVGVELLSGATADADSLPIFNPSDYYSYTVDSADATLRGRVSEASGSVRLWMFDHTTDLLGSSVATFHLPGTLSVQTAIEGRFYVETAATVLSVRASVGTAPTGASVICDVNKNGTTVFTSQANRPAIAAAAFASPLVTNMDVTAVAAGDYLSVDVDQVGSTVAGAGLTVQVRYKRA